MECAVTYSHQGNGELLEKKSERIQVGVTELDLFLLTLEMQQIASCCLPRKRVTSGDTTGVQSSKRNRIRDSELQQAIDHMKTQQNSLITTMKRKNKLMKGSLGGDSEQVRQKDPRLGGEAHRG